MDSALLKSASVYASMPISHLSMGNNSSTCQGDGWMKRYSRMHWKGDPCRMMSDKTELDELVCQKMLPPNRMNASTESFSRLGDRFATDMSTRA